MPGRHGSRYFPGVHWSGILLSDGSLWWNDDPWTWQSTQLMGHDFDDFSIGASCRLVYPFLCHHYPEKPSVNGSPGWEKSPVAFPAIKVKSDR